MADQANWWVQRWPGRYLFPFRPPISWIPSRFPADCAAWSQPTDNPGPGGKRADASLAFRDANVMSTRSDAPASSAIPGGPCPAGSLPGRP
ncbi:hypothetical protein ACFFX0_24615 [Citricoccus parietis]|uniref:Uncharacterized protein n=1 Tax=Citricoccus parietis TaxID=592307 RepID=A0ABV5G5J7_9MICC